MRLLIVLMLPEVHYLKAEGFNVVKYRCIKECIYLIHIPFA
ncbi:hypothetical protein GPLA_1347 [Paraglaciecola polaris LMG 21857]|uniref:Uncharacterized protein n=1 Tax=Paraglaciecola polaris LMG 21857 TaxID=1129793 RepID=K6Z7V7_9ALTE|nr:hypothetical protein GPLA_1347 [Paraglaciecola polaris LMG 21857]